MVNSVLANNENKNPTTGKWIGAGIGASWSGYRCYKTNKNLKNYDEFLASKEVKDILKAENINKFRSMVSDNSKISKKIQKKLLYFIDKNKNNPVHITNGISFESQRIKVFNKFKTPAMIVLVIITSGIGLGLGAIIDYFRKKDD